jgi:hypothetical protein
MPFFLIVFLVEMSFVRVCFSKKKIVKNIIKLYIMYFVFDISAYFNGILWDSIEMKSVAVSCSYHSIHYEITYFKVME